MIAIIIAGGRGERLKPLTDTIPKPMVEINGKPILLYTLELLKRHGIKDFIIALCYLPEKIVSYFGDGSKFGVNIQYTYEDSRNPLGTAGAILLARKYIKDTFIVTYADIIRNLDIGLMQEQHKETKALATLNVYKRKSDGAKSAVIFDKDKKIIDFTERPLEKNLQSEFIWSNGSFYILESEIFDLIPEGAKTDFGSDIFPKLLTEEKALYAFPTTDYFIDIANLEKINQAEIDIKNGLLSQ